MNKRRGGGGGGAGISIEGVARNSIFDIMDPACGHRILNSLDDQVLPLTSSEKRVVDEMDFFSDKSFSKHALRIDVKNENARDGLSTEYNRDVNTGLNLLTTNTTISHKPTADDGGASPERYERTINDQLAVVQAELDQMNLENQHLRAMLNQVNNNYYALQMHIVTLVQHQENRKDVSTDDPKMIHGVVEEKNQGILVPSQFMDLGQAAMVDKDDSLQSLSEGKTPDCSGSPRYVEEVSRPYELQKIADNDTVVPVDQRKIDRVDSDKIKREENPERSFQEWIPNNKVPKFQSPNGFDQPVEATMRKARVSVRARSEASMISDGCQWRKYGQKMAKGNPCPRAYYRCTMAVACPVRKQVQRSAEDQTILITTYEGNHNHPLPPAAMTMASTTTAAASMLLSGSMPSADGLMNSNILATTLLPCSPNLATISASAPFPTITLDLTNTPNLSHFQRPQPFLVPFPNTNHNFSFSSGPPGFGQAVFNQSKFAGLQNSQEMMSAATAAITADPNFKAALVAAITSIMGNAHPNSSSQ